MGVRDAEEAVYPVEVSEKVVSEEAVEHSVRPVAVVGLVGVVSAEDHVAAREVVVAVWERDLETRLLWCLAVSKAVSW